MALLKSRDQSFLENLFLEVNPSLLRVCVANGIRSEQAEEIIFETWDIFFTGLDRFEGRSQIRTFLCGILFNKIREYRKAAQRISYEEDLEAIINNSFTEDGWWKNDPHDPHQLLENKQSGAMIGECLEGLSDHQKAAFVMREVEEESTENICTTLGVNPSNLRILIFRAKDKLRKCLEGKFSGHWGKA